MTFCAHHHEYECYRGDETIPRATAKGISVRATEGYEQEAEVEVTFLEKAPASGSFPAGGRKVAMKYYTQESSWSSMPRFGLHPSGWTDLG